MSRSDEILETLRRHRPEMEAVGVRHASLFGSQARGDAKAGSDIDVAVRFDEDARPRGLSYFGALQRLSDTLSERLRCSVDIVDEEAFKPGIAKTYLRDRIRAF